MIKLWNHIPISKEKILNKKYFDDEVIAIESLNKGIDYYKYIYDNVDLDKTNTQNSHIMYACNKVSFLDRNKEANLVGKRASIADIDLDIAISFRENIIDYVKEKYGDDKTAHIITFNTLDGRGAVKEVFRIFGYSSELCNSITRRMVDTATIQDILEDIKESKPDYTTINYCIDNIPDIYNAYQDYQKEFDIAIKLSGIIRSTGKHAAGIVIDNKPLIDSLPVCIDMKTGQHIVALEMGDAEYVGVVKFDFLGVAAYEKIDKIMEMINNKLDEPSNNI